MPQRRYTYEDPEADFNGFGGGSSGGGGGGATWGDPYSDGPSEEDLYLDLMRSRRNRLVGFDEEPENPMGRYSRLYQPDFDEPQMQRSSAPAPRPAIEDMFPQRTGSPTPAPIDTRQQQLFPSHLPAKQTPPPMNLLPSHGGNIELPPVQPQRSNRVSPQMPTMAPMRSNQVPSQTNALMPPMRPMRSNQQPSMSLESMLPTPAQRAQMNGLPQMNPMASHGAPNALPPQTPGRPTGPSFARPGQRTIGYPNGMPASGAYPNNRAPQPLRNRPVQRPQAIPQSAPEPVQGPGGGYGIDPRSIASQNAPMGAPTDYFSQLPNVFNPRQGGPTDRPFRNIDFTAAPGQQAMGNATPESMRPQRRQLEAPQYNMTPMEEYTKYLQSEPNREDYKTGKWGTILNALSAGMESKDRGLGAGIKMYDELRDRPYQEEYKKWATRGSKTKAAVDLENARYNAVDRSYTRDAEQRRQDYTAETGRLQYKLAAEKFQAETTKEERELLTNGWVLKEGGDGFMQYTRISPIDGQPEYRSSKLPNKDFTAAETKARDDMLEKGRNARTAASNATSRSNTLANIRSRESEGFLNRQSSEWRDVTGPNSGGPKEDSPSNTNTATNLMKNRYSELDNKNWSDVVQVRGNKIKLSKAVQDMTPQQQEAFFIKKANGDEKLADHYYDLWNGLNIDALTFIDDEEE